MKDNKGSSQPQSLTPNNFRLEKEEEKGGGRMATILLFTSARLWLFLFLTVNFSIFGGIRVSIASKSMPACWRGRGPFSSRKGLGY
jgi:hypothetical protein